MKLNAIQQICKSAKRIELYTSPAASAQWISDGGAFYPLYNLPVLRDDTVFTLFDIPEKKRNKIRLEQRDLLPESICFTDHDEGDALLDQGKIAIGINGHTLVPLYTSLGAVYINAKYLAPFKDSENGVQLYERHMPSGAVYIAVKEGFLLTGIILPYDIITSEFIKDLEVMHRLTLLACDNRALLCAGVQEEIEQMEIEDETES